MTEFPVDVLGIIKTMTLRSIGNPNAFVYTINNILDAYKGVILMILTIVILIFLGKFIYHFSKQILKDRKNKEKLFIKKYVKEIFNKEKGIFKILKYPLIGSILILTSRMQVSILFWLFNHYNSSLEITKETGPFQEGWVLGGWATYALGIFIIAGCFIGLSFGNKLVRNIGILFYILGIFFIIFALFLDYGYISDGLGNLVI